MSLPMPEVHITEDLMKAYMTVPPVKAGEAYTVEYLTEILQLNGVKLGILTDNLEKIVTQNLYGKAVLVARGEETRNGDDGYFEYLFDTELSQKPVVQADGSVDFKNIKMIEVVQMGQKIAVYHGATAGKNGYNLTAQFSTARAGKELPPLKGTGFEQDKDGITYYATTGGKITVMNNRVNIFPVHEVFGDVSLSTGNIDFNGDVIIHGNVQEGMSIKASGTVTVDKVVESSYIDGKKGVMLRGGVLGKNGATIRSKGNITALFLEYADVETEGDITADSFLDSRVFAGGRIVLNGRKGRIVGGSTHALQGIEALEIGNMVGATTEVSVGIFHGTVEKMSSINQEVRDDEKQLSRIEEGLVQLETIMQEKGIDFRSDPRRMALVKEKLRLSALIAGRNGELAELKKQMELAGKSSIQVTREVYPGVRVGVDDQMVQVKEPHKTVEFKKYKGSVGMFNIGYTSQ